MSRWVSQQPVQNTVLSFFRSSSDLGINGCHRSKDQIQHASFDHLDHAAIAGRIRYLSITAYG